MGGKVGREDLKELLREIGSVVNAVDRRTPRRLWEAGLLHPRWLLGGAATLPWLAGSGISLGLATRVHALTRAGTTAIVDREGTLSWKQLDARANRLAQALLARQDGSDAGIATLLRNGREAVEALVAAQKAGLATSPLNTWASRDELAVLLERRPPEVLIYDRRHADQLRGSVPEETTLVAAGPGGGTVAGSLGYEDLLDRSTAAPPSPLQGRGTNRVVIHTSGTTGVPKAAARDLGSSGATAVLAFIQTVPYRGDDVIVCPAPIFHAFGLATVATSLVLGATLVLPDTFEPHAVLDLIEEHDATAVSMVPVMLRRVLDLPDDAWADRDLSGLRILLVSGSATSPQLRRETRERVGEVMYDLYGSTEAGWVAIATPATIRERPESVGRPVTGVEVAIVDTDGTRLPRGDTGRVMVRSGARFAGYLSGEEVDEEHGFLDTGDLGVLDEDGFLHIVGRADEMVVVGGENVYPIEVESVIDELDGVDDVAVLGVEDREYGQVLAAAVVGDVAADAVRAHCREKLASFKVPREVVVVDELPRTSTGKVRKPDLREQLATG
jgi:fatty-acyl-CoA synthase